MKNYEMLCVLPGTLAEDEVTPVVEKIKETLSSKGAQNISVKDMGKSKLAYPIKHIRYGYFQLFHFELETEQIADLEKAVRLLSNIIRITLRNYDPEKAKDYILAVDPTAPSAREKTEKPRENKSFKRPKKEVTPVETEVNKTEVKNTEPEVKETEDVVSEQKLASKKTENKKEKKEEKISMDDIDKKLEEILKKDIDNV